MKERKEILIGKYPQTMVSEGDKIVKLNDLSKELPNGKDMHDWIAYPYYNRAIEENYMFYKDIELDSDKYRGVYFTKYRPYYSNREAIKDNSNQFKNGYHTDTLYWFKWEPIVFEIIKEKCGEIILLSKKVIDAQMFLNDTLSVNPEIYYFNDWICSDVRYFLNKVFYEEAFNGFDLLTSKIETVNMADIMYSTMDKVYLLDSKDVINTEYGFNKGDGYNKYREKEASDYAVCQGVYLGPNGKASWWLRTPGYEDVGAYRVRFDGVTGGNGEGRKINSINGIVPVIKIKN